MAAIVDLYAILHVAVARRDIREVEREGARFWLRPRGAVERDGATKAEGFEVVGREPRRTIGLGELDLNRELTALGGAQRELLNQVRLIVHARRDDAHVAHDAVTIRIREAAADLGHVVERVVGSPQVARVAPAGTPGVDAGARAAVAPTLAFVAIKSSPGADTSGGARRAVLPAFDCCTRSSASRVGLTSTTRLALASSCFCSSAVGSRRPVGCKRAAAFNAASGAAGGTADDVAGCAVNKDDCPRVVSVSSVLAAQPTAHKNTPEPSAHSHLMKQPFLENRDPYCCR
jgi:hypothetical protein